MFLTNIKNEFYEFLAGKQICIIVHYDIDGICTCKILQFLLKHNHTLYSLEVVKGVSDLERVFRENSDDVNYFVLINCGGTLDVVEELHAKDSTVFFILDSHRPTHLCNIYSKEQVRLMWNIEENVQIPEYSEIFNEDEFSGSESEDGLNESDNESEERDAKKRRLGEEEILKRRERRLWEANRAKVLFQYSQFTYYSKASALIMFDLAWKLNRDDKDLLWYAIVALTEQMIFGKIENTEYVLETSNLQAHTTRLQNRSSYTDGVTSLKISFERDLRLVLYRHWSVASSLKYSLYTACKLKLWSLKGDARLQELLADMGLPLAQSRQNFPSMDLQLRLEFLQSIEKLTDKYGIPDIIYATFILTYGYRNKYCACDVVYGMLAILEASAQNKSTEESFQLALDALSRSHKTILNMAINKAKGITMTLFKTVQSAIEMKRIISAGPFIYYIIQEGHVDWYMFSHQHILSLLAQFIIRAYVAMSRNRKASSLPLIVSANKALDSGECIIFGIPPLCENSPKNFFGKAFEQAANQIKYNGICDYFDTAYLDIPIRDRTRFLDALIALLT